MKSLKTVDLSYNSITEMGLLNYWIPFIRKYKFVESFGFSNNKIKSLVILNIYYLTYRNNCMNWVT